MEIRKIQHISKRPQKHLKFDLRYSMPKYGKISTLKIIFFSFRLYIKIFEIFNFLLIPNIFEQNLVLSLPFCLFTVACASCRLLNGRILNITSDNLCSIYFCFLVENDFLQVKPARCHCLHKNTVFTITLIYIILCLTYFFCQLRQNIYTNLSIL